MKGIKKASEEYPSTLVKLLPSIDRSQGFSAAEETLSLVLDFLKDSEFKDIIKGIDLSGNPECGSFTVYKDLLTRAREAELKLALHCGEIENPNEIKEMLEFGMDRCGHGTFISGDNLKLLKEKRIPVECCLSSNLACGTVKVFNEHHFKDLFNSRHPVVVCVSLKTCEVSKLRFQFQTDDFGVFNSNLSAELAIASQSFSLTTSDVQELQENAVHCSFAGKEEKARILEEIRQHFRF